MTTIDLRREDDYRRETYGVLLTSKTVHPVKGRGLHNPSHNHGIDVWENRLEFTDGRAACYLSPSGQATENRYSFLLSARATVLALRPLGNEPKVGDQIETGGVVRLTIEGFPIGWFQIMTQRLRDPILVPVDIATSASRQYYIDSGEYLERALDD